MFGFINTYFLSKSNIPIQTHFSLELLYEISLNSVDIWVLIYTLRHNNIREGILCSWVNWNLLMRLGERAWAWCCIILAGVSRRQVKRVGNLRPGNCIFYRGLPREKNVMLSSRLYFQCTCDNINFVNIQITAAIFNRDCNVTHFYNDYHDVKNNIFTFSS